MEREESEGRGATYRLAVLEQHSQVLRHALGVQGKVPVRLVDERQPRPRLDGRGCEASRRANRRDETGVRARGWKLRGVSPEDLT